MDPTIHLFHEHLLGFHSVSKTQLAIEETNKLDTNLTKRSKNMKPTLTKYVNWVARSNNKCCGVEGEGAILPQVWGGRGKLGKFNISWRPTKCQAAKIPRWVKWKLAGVGFWCYRLASTPVPHSSAPGTSVFPWGFHAHFVTILMEQTIKVLWPEGRHEAQAQTSGKFYLEMSNTRNKNDGFSPQNISPKEISQEFLVPEPHSWH